MARGKRVADLDTFISAAIGAKTPRAKIFDDAIARFQCSRQTIARTISRIAPGTKKNGRPSAAEANAPIAAPLPVIHGRERISKPAALDAVKEWDEWASKNVKEPQELEPTRRDAFIERIKARAGAIFDRIQARVTSHLEDQIGTELERVAAQIDAALAPRPRATGAEIIARVHATPGPPITADPEPSIYRVEEREPREESLDDLDISKLPSGTAVRSGRPPEMGMRGARAAAATPPVDRPRPPPSDLEIARAVPPVHDENLLAGRRSSALIAAAERTKHVGVLPMPCASFFF